MGRCSMSDKWSLVWEQEVALGRGVGLGSGGRSWKMR